MSTIRGLQQTLIPKDTVIGANFGGLFILMFGTPLAVVFGLGTVIRSVQILRTTIVD